MKEKFSNIFIDMNNLFYRNYTTIEKVYNDEKELLVNTVKKCIQSINKLERERLGVFGTIWFLFDNPKSKINIRKEISDNYKANRVKEKNIFYKYLEKLKEYLLIYKDNYKVVYFDLLEADDFVLPILKYMKSEESVLLVSNDLDWARCIDYDNRNIKWFQDHKIIGKKEFKSKYGFIPSLSSVIIYKTIRGDIIDNIPIGLRSLPSKQLYKICEKFKDIKDLIFNIHKMDDLSDLWKKRIKERERSLLINWSLVDFISLDMAGTTIKDNIYTTKFNQLHLNLINNQLGLQKIKKSIKKENNGSFFQEIGLERR